MVLRLLYLIFLLVGFGRMADAQTTTTPTTTNQSKIVSISSGGYSNLTGLFLGDNNTSTTVIYGGTAGTLINGCASPSADSTCNNCAADTAPCNKKRIHDNLNLTIQFRPASTSTALPGGLAFVTNNVASGGGLQERLTIINQSPAGLIIPGNVASVSVTVRWGDICEKFFGGSAGCADAEPGTQVISLGIDENNDNIYDEVGVAEVQITLANMDLAATSLCKSGETHEGACNFRVFAGDSKVFLEDVQTDCGFPTYDDSTVKYLRLFREVVAANGSSTTPNALSTSDDFIISPTSSSCTTTKLANLNENTVDGLVNGTTYRFAVGLLDSANNLGGILDVSGESTDPDDNANCFTVDPDHPLNCHVATPDEVVGLIEKEFDCFITTATYGSAFRPKVEDFRKFRNAYLHTTWLGRKIIKFYYRHSPPIADWIRQHPQSKLVMRGILYPFWLFAKACLEFPILTILTLLLGLMGIGFGLKARGVRP